MPNHKPTPRAELAQSGEPPWPHDLLRTIYAAPETSRIIRRRIRASLPPVEVDYRGCRIRVHPADNNTEFQIWRIGRTQEERAIKTILSRLSGAPFLAYDVGANAGSFSLRLGKVAGSESRVRAFEPNPVMRSRLEHNLSLNSLDAVVVHNCAISDAEGELDFCIPNSSNLGQARLAIPSDEAANYKVAVYPLSHFAAMDQGRRIDFLKVDVEGFEDRVIAPLLDELPPSEYPRLLFFEHKHNGNWLIDLQEKVTSVGYTLTREYGRNALFEYSLE